MIFISGETWHGQIVRMAGGRLACRLTGRTTERILGATGKMPLGPTAGTAVPLCDSQSVEFACLRRRRSPNDVAGPRKRKLNFSDFRFRILAVHNVGAF